MRRVFLMSFLCVSGFTTIKETKGTNQTDIYHPGKYLVYNHDGSTMRKTKIQRTISKTRRSSERSMTV